MPEKEYIERGALLKQFEENEPQNWTNSDSEIQEEIDYACYRGLVETAPAADVVEVVRCKDCQHSYFIKCERWCTFHDVRMDDNDFCSYGAQMDGKGEANAQATQDL